MSRDVRWLLWVSAELAAEIDAAAATTGEDRSAWIRRKLSESLARGERPAFSQVGSSAPAAAVLRPQPPARTDQGVRWD